MKLTEKQWQRVAPVFETSPRESKKGRPATPARDVLNGVLWVLKTGARWKDLPREYPPYQTCHRRFQHWVAICRTEGFESKASFYRCIEEGLDES